RNRLEEGCVTIDLTIKEVLNAMWKRVLINELEASYAKEVLGAFLKLGIVMVVSQESFLEEAFSIALRRRITIYDSLFIALAKKKGLPLLTSDEKQAKVAEAEGVKVILV
ncbi:MAG: type II toxin-antitoxin system VapC family toxin, partial [Candidatus Methanomethylicaceae archaeon]